MNIIERIRNWMQEDELTYEEVASRIGWSRQNLWIKLNKSQYPNFDTIRKVLEAMGKELIVKPIDQAPAEIDLQKLYEVAEDQMVSFDVVEKLMNAIGYELDFNED